MRKAFLFSAGALLLAGCDFAGGSDAGSATISSLKAANLPEATGQPDLFFEIQDATGRSYYRSPVQEGASTEEFATAIPDGFQTPSTAMYVAVYDFEGSLNTSKMLARSAGFTADQVSAAPLQLEDAPFRHSADTEATFTVTGSTAAE